eukprot:m.200613 g.200613  ORF g.200613 m.200613 type:complete len:50 (-) comp18408_c2_seq8:1180-1329(-)
MTTEPSVRNQGLGASHPESLWFIVCICTVATRLGFDVPLFCKSHSHFDS